jgi:hypothetical protein
MAIAEGDTASIEARVARASSHARELLWAVTRASEPLTPRLIERVWSGESLHEEFLRRIGGELDALPAVLRSSVEAQLPAAVLAEIEALARRPSTRETAPLAPLLAELTELGLVARAAGEEEPPFEFSKDVTTSISAWMAARPEELRGRTEASVFRTLGERYVGAFEALAATGPAADEGAQDLALETGRRGIRYLVRAYTEETGGVAARMLGAASAPTLRARLLRELVEAPEEAPPGARRRAARAAIAAGLVEAAGRAEDGAGRDATSAAEGAAAGAAMLDRALSLYEHALDEAEDAADEPSAREAATISERLAEGLERAGRQAAARDAFRRAAANARRAGRARAEVIALELEAARLGVRQGTDVEATLATVARHVDELHVLTRQARAQDGAEAARAAEHVREALLSALDLGAQIELALERWPEAEARLEQAESILRETGADERALAVNRCKRYLPLARLRRFDEAARVLESSLAVFVEVGDGAAEVGTRSRLADLWDERGEPRRAVEAARAALGASEQHAGAALRADAHESLANYLEKAGDEAEARDQKLASLVYRLVARLDVSRALRALNLDAIRATARGERHGLPRLDALLARDEFAALRDFLAESGVHVSPLEDGIRELVATVQAGTKASAPSSEP